MAYEVPKLPYAYDALEPYIDEETMHIHHDKHHQAYVDKLNGAVKGSAVEGKDINVLLADLNAIPEEVRTAVRNFGGGHANHSMYWDMMSPDGGKPEGKLLEAIEKKWGSMDKFTEEFSGAAAKLFGSGWTWLVVDKGELAIVSTLNQDTPASDGKIPIFVIDLWEHAYYLKYQNKRPEYIKAFFSVVNWKKVAELFEGA